MNRFKILAALAFGAALATAQTASATAVLYISDGITDITITDNTPVCGAQPCDSNAAVDVVTWIGTIGVWTINVSTGVTESPTPSLDLNSVNSSTGAGSLVIGLFDTDFLAGAGPFTADFTIGGTQDNGSIGLFQAVVNTANAQTGIGVPCDGTIVQCVNFGPLAGNPFSGSGAPAFTLPGGPFGMGIFVIVNHTQAGLTSFDARLRVPEPGTLALLAVAALAFGLGIRRKSGA